MVIKLFTVNKTSYYFCFYIFNNDNEINLVHSFMYPFDTFWGKLCQSPQILL